MTSSLLDRSQNNFMGSNRLLPGRRSGGGGGGRRGGGIRRFGFRRVGGLLNYTGGGYGGAMQMTGPIHTQMKRPTARRYSFASAKPATIPKWQPGIYQHVRNMVPATIKTLGIETGTKLYVSNLDYGVSTYDLKELFAEVGNLKRCSIHYDGNGRSKGTAEVVFAMKADAIAAMKQYNAVPLDGRPMHIELIGTNLSTSAVQATVPLARQTGLVVQAGARPTPSAQRIVVMGAGSQRHGYSRGFRHGSVFRGRGRGRLADHRHGRVPLEEKSAEDLDAELETYRAEAMQI
ncbi:unnamed protein product [Sphagnum troendelagicum]|uniref:RRM domain-containing protein n=1 Tax=Sphagnum troendelagicum TaxID=128251 RepID=A0ABP0U897_9BRYO